jgi:alpha-L-fucosidase
MAPDPISEPALAPDVPSYLAGYEELYAKDPRRVAIEWFREARFGLFLHYGLYSLLGNHEWVQLRQLIPVAEYAKLHKKFTAEKFDADFITDLALAAGMKYVNITTRHHDSFCLFRTAQTDFNSVSSPASRDLVGELSEACARKGLGMFFYYSHGRDWKHPHAPNNDAWGGHARPEYDPPESTYATGGDHDLQKYVDFMSAQIRELLTQYGPVAGIWLDGIATTRSGPTEQFHSQELYDMVHSLQPQVLVSYIQGLLGTEDFFAPEHKGIENSSGKPMEICTTLQEQGWGWVKGSRHRDADEAMAMLQRAADVPANLLLNTGPLDDGSIHPEDEATLREVGRRLAGSGFPNQ